MTTRKRGALEGAPIERDANGVLRVPETPIVPYIEGDGIGRDIVPVMIAATDAAVTAAYGGARRIAWREVLAGEKARAAHGPDASVPDETVDTIRRLRVAIKGPLSAGVGGGTRSPSATLRSRLDCYAQLRPVKYLPGAPSPLRAPEGIDLVVFRETSEDVYLGIEWGAGTPEARRLLDFLAGSMGVHSIPFPGSSAIAIKPISREGTRRLVRRAIRFAQAAGRRSVTLVHKGTVLKLTEGAFAAWGYELARDEFGAVDSADPGCLRIDSPHGPLLIRDTIADAFMQQSVLRPTDFDVVVTTCQNGDYVSSSLAALVGGPGIAPGANMADDVTVFEPSHGSAPGHAGRNVANPGGMMLSAAMMLEHLGWSEAARTLEAALAATIASGTVTYDFARAIEGLVPVSTSAFGEAVVSRMVRGVPGASPPD